MLSQKYVCLDRQVNDLDGAFSIHKCCVRYTDTVDDGSFHRVGDSGGFDKIAIFQQHLFSDYKNKLYQVNLFQN